MRVSRTFIARRKAGRLGAAALLAAVAVSLWQPPALAFEIFGFRLFGSDEEDEQVVDPVHYEVSFEVEGDESLEQRLRNASRMLADEERPVSGSLGVLAKARDERQLLVATLYEEARYNGVVDIRIEGRLLDDLAPDAEFDTSRPVPISITVRPGREFRLGDVRLAGETSDLIPARFGLIAGGDASSTAILQASGRMVEELKKQGRPLARVEGRDVIADSATGELDVTITLAAGPVAPFGPTTVDGTESVDRDFTEYMAGIEQGKIYDPEDVKEAEERLLALEVFDSVRVVEAEGLAADGSIPIGVTVTERKHRYFGAGATISNTEGLGLEGYWGHRNLFGRAERLRFQGSISRIGASDQFEELNYNAAILFEKPGVIGPASKFTADIKSAWEHPDAYDKLSLQAGIGISYELTSNQTVKAGARIEWAEIEDSFGINEYLIVSTPLEYVYDNRDNPLNAKRGVRLLGYVEPAYDFESGAMFVKMRGEASAYQALDANQRIVAAGRVAMGSIVGASLTEVPADRRFYAGGGGSVRGYAYQGIGPKALVNGELQPTGGLSYAEASAELRVEVTNSFGLVPFVDAGTVSVDPFPDFSNIKVGAGLGIRYATPFGPIRLDVAVPLNPGPGDPSYGIYAGIGQAF
ncbi:MAG: autotransporter assembly complex protein TamA [Rhizobiaceae bacterium]|nr:autotransporter assembly complex protein TamA [Rhizobiaceae bacterium]MCV0407828.1 autotransporter assembly complex protein TamA [Rhizobiaceae bacterium]